MDGYRFKGDNKSFAVKSRKLGLDFNPVVLVLSVASVATLLCACLLLDNKVPQEFAQWFDWVSETWVWFHVGSRDIMIIVFVYIFFSRFANLKLSRSPDEKPEFSSVTWFAMTFLCGSSLSLFLYSVSEPLRHYTGQDGVNRYYGNPYVPDNTLAQHALNLTFFHNGLHAWITFCVVGLVLAVLAHRENLPLSFKSCFYPLMGDAVFSWIGDVIDSWAVLAVFIAFVYELAQVAGFINTGLNLLIDEIYPKDWIQIIIVWTILLFSGIFSLFGLSKALSKLCLASLIGFGSLLGLIWMLDDSWYLSNLLIQSTGFYFNWLLQLGSHTDAFEQHSPSYGSAERARDPSILDGIQGWFQSITFSFLSLYMAWTPFVGVFLARISKGRTIREFILGTLVAPVALVFIWITIFGGAAISSERLAHSQSYCCDQNWDEAAVNDDTVTNPLLALTFNQANAAPLCVASACNVCATSTLASSISQGFTFAEFIPSLRRTLKDDDDGTRRDGFQFIQNYMGPSPLDSRRDVAKLTCVPSDQQMFILIRGYFELTEALNGIVLFVMFLFAVSVFALLPHVMNMMSSNGKMNPSRLLTIFWVILIGGSCTALLTVEGSFDQDDIAIISYLLAFPVSAVVLSLVISLYRALRVTAGEVNSNSLYWRAGYFDFCTVASKEPILGWLKNVFLGPYISSKAYCIVREIDDRFALVFSAIMYGLLLALAACNPLRYYVVGLWAFGWVSYLAFVCILAVQRQKVRAHLEYDGSGLEDVLACLFCYPSVCYQLELELKNGLSPENNFSYREATKDFDSMSRKEKKKEVPLRSNRVQPAPVREDTPPRRAQTPPRQRTPTPPPVLLPVREDNAELVAQQRRRGGVVRRELGTFGNFV